MISLLIIPLSAIANRVRGGGFVGGKIGATALMAVGFFILELPYMWIGVLAGLWLLGVSFGWTKWINGMAYPRQYKDGRGRSGYDQEKWNAEMLSDDTGTRDGSKWITDKITGLIGIYEDSDFEAYCWGGFFVRGLYWWVPFYIAASIYTGSLIWCAVALAASVLLLPIAYSFAYLRLAPPDDSPRHEEGFLGLRYLERAEYLYGLIYGLAMWLVFTFA